MDDKNQKPTKSILLSPACGRYRCSDENRTKEEIVIVTGRFGHHYNPGMDFVMEVNALAALALSPDADRASLRHRIEKAMDFRPGGYPEAVAAKETLRHLETATADLGPATDRLVREFAVALRVKLAAAEAKYGRRDDWATDNWEDDCRQQLRAHLDKGDPLDVAAYCAFMWSRGWSTAEPETVDAGAP
jgi:hypothetical protein